MFYFLDLDEFNRVKLQKRESSSSNNYINASIVLVCTFPHLYYFKIHYVLNAYWIFIKCCLLIYFFFFEERLVYNDTVSSSKNNSRLLANALGTKCPIDNCTDRKIWRDKGMFRLLLVKRNNKFSFVDFICNFWMFSKFD